MRQREALVQQGLGHPVGSKSKCDKLKVETVQLHQTVLGWFVCDGPHDRTRMAKQAAL